MPYNLFFWKVHACYSKAQEEANLHPFTSSHHEHFQIPYVMIGTACGIFTSLQDSAAKDFWAHLCKEEVMPCDQAVWGWWWHHGRTQCIFHSAHWMFTTGWWIPRYLWIHCQRRAFLLLLRTTNSDFNNKSVYHIQDSLLPLSWIFHNKYCSQQAHHSVSSERPSPLGPEMSGCGSTEALGPAERRCPCLCALCAPVSVPCTCPTGATRVANSHEAQRRGLQGTQVSIPAVRPQDVHLASRDLTFLILKQG